MRIFVALFLLAGSSLMLGACANVTDQAQAERSARQAEAAGQMDPGKANRTY